MFKESNRLFSTFSKFWLFLFPSTPDHVGPVEIHVMSTKYTRQMYLYILCDVACLNNGSFCPDLATS